MTVLRADSDTPRILLVDESDAQRSAVTDALRAVGFQVIALGRAQAALPLWPIFRPQLVVLATHAPAFSSVAVARRLQSHTRGAVPFLYLLDAPDPELRLHVLERGHGIDAVSKPLDLRDLVARVRALLRFRAAMRQAAGPEEDEEQLRDPLTRTWSRRALLAFLHQESLRCERHGGGFGLLGIQLEGLRQFRRASGRALADRLVRYASSVLLQEARDADVVARVATDRFVVLLPSTPAEGLPWVRARTAERFERARFQVDGRFVRLPVSLGLAAFPDIHGSPGRLLTAVFRSIRRPDLAQMSLSS
jgi:two-component system cell cycle response regulator